MFSVVTENNLKKIENLERQRERERMISEFCVIFSGSFSINPLSQLNLIDVLFRFCSQSSVPQSLDPWIRFIRNYQGTLTILKF